jgi:hypothetical protein
LSQTSMGNPAGRGDGASDLRQKPLFRP